MLESHSPRPLLRWLRIRLTTGRWITGGILIASIPGEQLLRERVPHSPWQRTVFAVEYVALLLTVIEGFISMPSWLPDKRSQSDSDEDALLFLLALSWLVLMVLRKHEWASLALGVITGLYFWMIGRMRQRHLLVAVGGGQSAGSSFTFSTGRTSNGLC